MKTRTADRVVAWSTWLLLPWVLSGCGEQVFEARVGERWVSFQDVKTQLLPGDASARKLRACGLHDPLPNAIDDEMTMCLSLVLDLERVDAAGAGAMLEVDGVARLTQASDALTLTFEPGAGHAPAVLSGHADLLCFAIPGTEPVTQHLQGRITLRQVTPISLVGRVDLSLEGELAGRQCSAFSGPAVFDFGFDVER